MRVIYTVPLIAMARPPLHIRALCFVGTRALVGILALIGAMLLVGLAATIRVLTLGINGLLTMTTT